MMLQHWPTYMSDKQGVGYTLAPQRVWQDIPDHGLLASGSQSDAVTVF